MGWMREAWLTSEDPQEWADAVCACQIGAPWDCTERGECLRGGDCFTTDRQGAVAAWRMIQRLHSENAVVQRHLDSAVAFLRYPTPSKRNTSHERRIENARAASRDAEAGNPSPYGHKGNIVGRTKTKAAVVETGPDIRETWVDAPLASWSQFLHELERGTPHAGRERAMVDRRTLLGGFCRFHGTEAQEKAAARFKAIYERAQVGGAKAVDPSREPVDGGGINPESVIEIGADARRAYNEIHTKFGRQVMTQLEFVIVHDHGPTAYARWMLRSAKPDGREVGRVSVAFRAMVEQLAVHLKLQTRAA